MISNASASLHPFELGPSWILNFLIYLGRRRAAMEEERKRREERSEEQIFIFLSGNPCPSAKPRRPRPRPQRAALFLVFSSVTL